MAIDVTVLRVFTDADGRFGNPLGVVDASTVAPADRQRLATELGYSETIFIDVPDPGANTAHARIFTPATELPFAGHPTLGSCHAWLEAGGRPRADGEVVQECGAGLVTVRRDGDRLIVRVHSNVPEEFPFVARSETRFASVSYGIEFQLDAQGTVTGATWGQGPNSIPLVRK